MTLPQTITLEFPDHRDADGNRIVGETWDFTGSVGPDGAFTPTASEPFADGRYTFTHTATSYGAYWFEIQALSDPTNVDYHQSIVVSVTPTTADPPTAAAIAAEVVAQPVAGSDAGTVGAALTKIGSIGTGRVNELAVGASAGNLRLFKGNDYLAVDGRALEWTTEDEATWPDLTSADIDLVAVYTNEADVSFAASGEVDVATGDTKAVHVDLPAAMTAPDGILLGKYDFAVNATLVNTHKVTLVAGTLQLIKKITI